MVKQTRLARVAGWIDTSGRYIETVTGAVCVVMFALMVIVIMLGVFFRYIIVDPLQWSEELARFLMLWVGFMAMNIATRQEQHLRIDSLVSTLPKKAVDLLAVIGNVLIICFLVVLITKGYQMTMRTMVTASSMPFSMFWVYMSVPLGAALSLMQLLLNILRNTMNRLGDA